jgi:hypothetical protein
VALVIAVLGAYVWAFQISSARDIVSVNEEPAMKALEEKFEKEKANVQFSASTVEYVAAPQMETHSKLGPAKTGEIGPQTRIMQNFAAGMPSYEPVRMPEQKLIVNTAAAEQQTNLITAKYENDKKEVVAGIRSADSKKKFFPALAILFIGLAGLNVFRMKMSAKS